MDLIDPMRPDAIENLCKLLVMLSEIGELARRHYGYDHGPMLDAETIEDLPVDGTPEEIVRLHGAAKLAIVKGFSRSVKAPTEKEVDLGLIELEKQKKTGTTE